MPSGCKHFISHVQCCTLSGHLLVEGLNYLALVDIAPILSDFFLVHLFHTKEDRVVSFLLLLLESDS